jgi:hypothetical protein
MAEKSLTVSQVTGTACFKTCTDLCYSTSMLSLDEFV